MSWPLLQAATVDVDCFDVPSCHWANLVKTTYKMNICHSQVSFCHSFFRFSQSSRVAQGVFFFLFFFLHHFISPLRHMHTTTTLCATACIFAEMSLDAAKVRGRRGKEARQRDGKALKSLWVDFHCGEAFLSSLLHVCSSKDTDNMLLLFDFTCAVFLIRTTLGSEAVLVISLL